MLYCRGCSIIYVTCVDCLLGRIGDTMEEVHLQTAREREIERQLSYLIRQLHNRTEKATKRLRMMKRERSSVSTRECLHRKNENDILTNVEKAEKMLSELEQHRRKEQDVVDECRKACERFIDRALEEDVSVGRETEKRSREDAWTGVRTLKDNSLDEINQSREVAWTRIEILKGISERALDEYRAAQRDRTPTKRLIFEFNRLDHALSAANDRKVKLREELRKSDERLGKCTRQRNLRHLHEFKDRISTCSDEVQQSEARRNQFQRLIDDRYTEVEQPQWVGGVFGRSWVQYGDDVKETKLEQARKVAKDAQKAVRNELELVEKEKVEQQDISASSKRMQELQQEITQTGTRETWLDELKSICGEDTGAHELCQQASTESNSLKEQLTEEMRNEEQMLQRLQEMDENQKSLKKTLEMMSERIQNTREKIDRVWQGSEQADQTSWIMENEEKLQKRLKEASAREERIFLEASAREQRIQVENERAASKEKEMQQALRQAYHEEESLISKLTGLKELHGKCSLSYIFKKAVIWQGEPRNAFWDH